jgi:zinc transport system substrate-binding protein
MIRKKEFFMKKLILLASILLVSLSLASCQQEETYDVVTTLFPQYDITRAIAQDDLTYINVLPFAASPHSFELTSQNRQIIESAELFIYTSDLVEQWASQITTSTLTKLNLEAEIEAHHEDHEHEEEAHDDHDHVDVHYWTNPEAMHDMVEVILDHLIELKPELKDVFTERAHAYLEELERLSLTLSNFLMSYTDTDVTLYIAGHNAMAEFGEYFAVEIVSLFPDFIPDAELTSSELVTFMSTIKTNQIHAFFIEPTFEQQPLAAQTIQTQLENENYEVQFYVLHQFHNISENDASSKLSLFDIYEQNIANIMKVIQTNYGTR